MYVLARTIITFRAFPRAPLELNKLLAASIALQKKYFRIAEKKKLRQQSNFAIFDCLQQAQCFVKFLVAVDIGQSCSDYGTICIDYDCNSESALLRLRNRELEKDSGNESNNLQKETKSEIKKI